MDPPHSYPDHSVTAVFHMDSGTGVTIEVDWGDGSNITSKYCKGLCCMLSVSCLPKIAFVWEFVNLKSSMFPGVNFFTQISIFHL